LVSRHATDQGARRGERGHPNLKKRSGPGRWHNRPGADRVVGEKAQTYCLRLERLVPWFLKSGSCLHTYELLKKTSDHALDWDQWNGAIK
jgi:hypothetical protein